MKKVFAFALVVILIFANSTLTFATTVSDFAETFTLKKPLNEYITKGNKKQLSLTEQTLNIHQDQIKSNEKNELDVSIRLKDKIDKSETNAEMDGFIKIGGKAYNIFLKGNADDIYLNSITVKQALFDG